MLFCARNGCFVRVVTCGAEDCARMGYLVRRVAFGMKVCAREDLLVHKTVHSCSREGDFSCSGHAESVFCSRVSIDGHIWICFCARERVFAEVGHI